MMRRITQYLGFTLMFSGGILSGVVPVLAVAMIVAGTCLVFVSDA